MRVEFQALASVRVYVHACAGGGERSVLCVYVCVCVRACVRVCMLGCVSVLLWADRRGGALMCECVDM